MNHDSEFLTTYFSVSTGILKAREQFEVCRGLYEKLAKMIPSGQYYRYNDHWSYLTQRLVFLISLTIFLEKGFLVDRNTVAEILGRKCKECLNVILIGVFMNCHFSSKNITS